MASVLSKPMTFTLPFRFWLSIAFATPRLSLRWWHKYRRYPGWPEPYQWFYPSLLRVAIAVLHRQYLNIRVLLFHPLAEPFRALNGGRRPGYVSDNTHFPLLAYLLRQRIRSLCARLTVIGGDKAGRDIRVHARVEGHHFDPRLLAVSTSGARAFASSAASNRPFGFCAMVFSTNWICSAICVSSAGPT